VPMTSATERPHVDHASTGRPSRLLTIFTPESCALPAGPERVLTRPFE
jgi:hypothetical protein